MNFNSLYKDIFSANSPARKIARLDFGSGHGRFAVRATPGKKSRVNSILLNVARAIGQSPGNFGQTARPSLLLKKAGHGQDAGNGKGNFLSLAQLALANAINDSIAPTASNPLLHAACERPVPACLSKIQRRAAA